MAYVPTTGNGSALAAQMRANIMTGTGIVPWLQANNIPTSRFLVGEMGIPGSSNPLIDDNYDPGFTLVLQQVFLDINALNMHFAYWAAGEWNLDIKAYRNIDGSNKAINYVTTAGVVLEANLSGAHGVTAKRGVNLWGAEASDSGPNGGLNAGVYGGQYYFPQADDWKALASRGINFVRLPIRWERVQPTLKGALDTSYLNYIKQALVNAGNNNISVLLDIHNYAKYDTTPTGAGTGGVYKLGQSAPSTHNGASVGGTMNDCFADLWSRLASVLKTYPAIWGYGLCNEPVDCPNGAADWQAASRQAVEAIRLVDQTNRIIVGGYFYSGIAQWSQNNGPSAWLTETIPAGQTGAGAARNTDPLIIFEGHMYFDYDGTYTGSGGSFPVLNQQAINAGFAAYNNNQPPDALPITSQTGDRSVFTSEMDDIGDWTVPAGGGVNSFAGTNTVVIPNTDFGTGNTLKIITTNTSDEGAVRKTLLTGQTAKTLSFKFALPTGASLSTTQDFAIMHCWDQNYYTGSGSTNMFEVRVIGSGSGYKLRLTDPNGSYTTVTGSTVLPFGSLQTIKTVVSNTDVKLYLNGGTAAEVTLTKTLTNLSVGGVALGKFYGTSYVGPMYYDSFSALQPGAVYDAPPNGGLFTYGSATTTTTTTQSSGSNDTSWTGQYPDGTPYEIPGLGTTVVNVTNNAQLTAALAAAAPGQKIVLAAGIYSGTFNVNGVAGTAAQPVSIEGAANLGSILASGQFYFKNSSYVTVKGLDVPFDGEPFYINDGSHHIRITRNRVGPASWSDQGTALKNWVQISGIGIHHNTIDYNTFRNKGSGNNLLRIYGNFTTNQVSQYNLVHHNKFDTIQPYTQNDKECIRYGVSQMSRSDGFGVVERNYFTNIGGEPEIVSIKATTMRVQGNTTYRCVGSLSIRHGRNSILSDNYCIDDQNTTSSTGTNGSGGVRFYDSGHTIEYNYMTGLNNGNFESSLIIDTGDAQVDGTDPLNGHWRIKNATVRRNVIVNTKEPIKVGENYTYNPTGCTVNDNITANTVTAGPIYYRAGAQLENSSVFNNNAYASPAAAGLTADADGIFRKDGYGPRLSFIGPSMAGYDAAAEGSATTTTTTTAATTNTTTSGFTQAQRNQEKAFELTSTCENSTIQWWLQYGYIEDIHDNRGYTGGLVGFTSADGDMEDMVKNYYIATQPNAALKSFLTGLHNCTTTGEGSSASSAATSNLGASYITAWKNAAANDSLFRAAQRNYRQDNYWAPAFAVAQADGLGALGAALYYDTYVNHGPGVANSGDGSFEDIRSKTTATSPANGGNQKTFLLNFLSKRSAVLTAWGDNPSDGRISMFTALVNTSNFTLTTPFSWSVYGDSYTMATEPDPYTEGSSGTTTTTTIPNGTFPATPAELLWIGGNPGQNHFNVGIGKATHTDYSQATIASGLVVDPGFKLNAAKTAVEFWVQVNGATTSSNTKYPRSELREYLLDGVTKASWGASTGTHYMKGKSKITHLPATKPWVCFAQIHNADDDVLRMQIEGTTGNLNITARLNDVVTVIAPYTVGTEIDWYIEVTNGNLTVKVGGVTALTGSITGDGNYFKAGCYAQSNTGTENGDASQYFSVELRDLVVWHTGYPAPTTPLYTGTTTTTSTTQSGGGGTTTTQGTTTTTTTAPTTTTTTAPTTTTTTTQAGYHPHTSFDGVHVMQAIAAAVLPKANIADLKPVAFSGSYNDLADKPANSGNVQADWNATTGQAVILNKPTLFSGAYADLTGKPSLFSGSYTDLTNKPTIPAAQVNSDWNAASGVAQILNKPTLFSGAYADLTGKPTLFSGAYADLTGKPSLFSGAYADLTGKPTLFSGAYADLTGKPSLFSGAYSDLSGKPSILTGLGVTVAQTANFTAAVNTRYAVDTSGGNVTMNLPTTASKGDRIFAQKKTGDTNQLIYSGKINGVAATTLTIRLNDQGKMLEFDGTDSWNVTSGDLSLTSLDARYIQSLAPITLDTANNRAGVNKTAPSETLDVVGNFQVGDASTSTKSYRFRTSGSNLDVDFSGADAYVSVFSSANYGGTQRNYLRLEAGAALAHGVGKWIFSDTPYGGAKITVDGTNGNLTVTGTSQFNGNVTVGPAGVNGNGVASSSIVLNHGTHSTTGTTSSIYGDYNNLYMSNPAGHVVQSAYNRAHSYYLQENGGSYAAAELWFDGASAGATGVYLLAPTGAGNVNLQLGDTAGANYVQVMDSGGAVKASISSSGVIKLTGGSPAAGKFLVTDANGVGSWQRPPFPIPSDNNMISWSADPAAINSSNIVATAGQVNVIKLFVPAATTITNVILRVTSSGSGLTSGQNLAALYTSAGALLAATADQSTSWNSTGTKVMALSAAQSVAAGTYYLAFFANGTTLPTFAAGSTAATGANGNLTTATARYALADTGRTTSMPATLAAFTATNVPFWGAFS